MTKKKEEIIIEEKIDHGFDRGLDYADIKKKLIDKFNELEEQIAKLDENDKAYDRRKKVLSNKLIYCLVSLIQLKNGCRIIEACKSIKIFFNKENIKDKILVKIAKSESTKSKEKKGKTIRFKTKPRFRKIVFPSKWINFEITPEIKGYLENIKIINLKQRVLDYLRKYFQCNTHSLRYAFINYMLYEKKIEMNLVAKFVGHVNVAQLVRYSQAKNAEGIFDID